MTEELRNDSDSASKSTLSVVAIFEDTVAREMAVKFCEHLMHQFWARYEFDVSWWSYGDIQEPQSARTASAKAVASDLIIFATRPHGELPIGLKIWIDSWLGQRGDREGALVGLMDPGTHQSGDTADKYIYLRNVAHRGGMDYLTQIPQDISRSVPDSLDSYSKRADEVTSVLDEILHQPPPSPRLTSI